VSQFRAMMSELFRPRVHQCIPDGWLAGTNPAKGLFSLVSLSISEVWEKKRGGSHVSLGPREWKFVTNIESS